MSEIFSFFSPKLSKKVKTLKMKSVVAEHEVLKEEEDTCVFDERLTGIVNLNYESFGEDDGHDLSSSVSVESLTIALQNLEEKKKSLEEEINNLYKDEIGYDDMLEIVAKILATSRVAIPSSIEEDNIADIDDCFEMLKSTASFVDKRLRKIRTKPKPDVSIKVDEGKDKVVDDVTVNTSSIIENVEESCVYRSCIEYKEEEDELNIKNSVESIEYKKDFSDDPVEISVSNSSGEETLTKRVSYEDFVNNIDAKEETGIKDALAGKDKFGPQKTRWSLRRVFKKKNSHLN